MIKNPVMFIGEKILGGTSGLILSVDSNTALTQTTGFTLDSTGLFTNPSEAYAYLSSTFSTTSTTATAITGLSFATGANQVWTFEAYLDVTSSTAAGLKLTWSGGANTNGRFQTIYGISAYNYSSLQMNNGVGGVTPAMAGSINTDSYVQTSGCFETGASSGTFQFQIQKVTSGTATCEKYSYFRARRIA